jgi:hypothetical protein
MSQNSRLARVGALLLVPGLVACGGSEAARVDLPMSTAAGAIPAATTDLGYAVTLEQLRIAVSDIELTVEGEMPTAAPVIAPHPGHSAGGEVTGELPGDHILTWDGAAHALGTATLLVGDYRGANVAFRAATASDGLADGDPLIGHTFHLIGAAARDGVTTRFDAVLDIDPGTWLIGAVFEDVVTESSTETLAVRFLPTDPLEGDTPFDGVAFAELTPSADGAALIRPGDVAHNVLRRQIQVHDHYAIEAP